LPVTGDARAMRIADGHLSRGELEDAADQRARRWRDEVGEVIGEGVVIELGMDGGVGEESLHLRSEHQPAGDVAPVEGLLTQAIARQEQALSGLVPEGKREHAVHQLQAVQAVAFVEAKEDLGVTASVERDAFGLEIVAETRIVVDLAVVDEALSGAAVHGLGATGDVDDGEAAMTEAHTRVAADEQSLAVRAPVAEGVAHGDDQIGGDGGLDGSVLVYARESAHPESHIQRCQVAASRRRRRVDEHRHYVDNSICRAGRRMKPGGSR